MAVVVAVVQYVYQIMKKVRPFASFHASTIFMPIVLTGIIVLLRPYSLLADILKFIWGGGFGDNRWLKTNKSCPFCKRCIDQRPTDNLESV